MRQPLERVLLEARLPLSGEHRPVALREVGADDRFDPAPELVVPEHLRKREWGLGQIYRSSEHRAAALSHWLSHYNTRNRTVPSALPPISRVHSVPRQDI